MKQRKRYIFPLTINRHNSIYPKKIYLIDVKLILFNLYSTIRHSDHISIVVEGTYSK